MVGRAILGRVVLALEHLGAFVRLLRNWHLVSEARELRSIDTLELRLLLGGLSYAYADVQHGRDLVAGETERLELRVARVEHAALIAASAVLALQMSARLTAVRPLAHMRVGE